MSMDQFLIQLAVTVIVVGAAVEVAIRIRWKTIEAMFSRALMHGGSLDTLSRALRSDSRETKEIAAGAVAAVSKLKDRVDEHQRYLDWLKEQPILRPLGGGGDMGSTGT